MSHQVERSMYVLSSELPLPAGQMLLELKREITDRFALKSSGLFSPPRLVFGKFWLDSRVESTLIEICKKAMQADSPVYSFDEPTYVSERGWILFKRENGEDHFSENLMNELSELYGASNGIDGDLPLPRITLLKNLVEREMEEVQPWLEHNLSGIRFRLQELIISRQLPDMRLKTVGKLRSEVNSLPPFMTP